MPDALAAALALPGLGWLVALTFATGLLYGFAGFGSALVFMPLATLVISPLVAAAAFSASALSSLFTVFPRAWAEADKPAVLTLFAAVAVATPVGQLALRFADPDLLRWAISGAVLATLAALLAGWRYTGRPGRRAWLGVGGIAGLVGGATGLHGPALVLFQLGGSDSVARSRANTIVVLTLSGLAFLPLLALQGALPGVALGLGALLLLPFAAGTLIGRRLFDPARAGMYRKVAFSLIGAAGLIGLPIGW
jgi:hypothetical protein